MPGKHTPGPWNYGVRKDGSIWLSCGDPIQGPHEQFDIGENEDTARLIAAAPEMLEALKEAQVSIDADADPTTYHRISAVIRKAEGQSHD